MAELPPEVAFQRALDEATRKYIELKKLTASIVVRRDDVRARLEKARAALSATARNLDAALDRQNDDAALAIMQAQQDGEREVAQMVSELEQAETDAEEAKAALLEVRDGLQKLKNDRGRILAQKISADLREQLDGLSLDADIVALENVRSHIHDTIAQERLQRELGGDDLEARLRAEKSKSSDALLRAQLDALKKARAPGAHAAAGPAASSAAQKPGEAEAARASVKKM